MNDYCDPTHLWAPEGTIESLKNNSHIFSRGRFLALYFLCHCSAIIPSYLFSFHCHFSHLSFSSFLFLFVVLFHSCSLRCPLYKCSRNLFTYAVDLLLCSELMGVADPSASPAYRNGTLSFLFGLFDKIQIVQRSRNRPQIQDACVLLTIC